MPRKWEYKVINLGRNFWPGPRQEKQLNELGDFGWELIDLGKLSDTGDSYMILKREKK